MNAATLGVGAATNGEFQDNSHLEARLEPKPGRFGRAQGASVNTSITGYSPSASLPRVPPF
jgi:hypothetical protein